MVESYEDRYRLSREERMLVLDIIDYSKVPDDELLQACANNSCVDILKFYTIGQELIRRGYIWHKPETYQSRNNTI